MDFNGWIQCRLVRPRIFILQPFRQAFDWAHAEVSTSGTLSLSKCTVTSLTKRHWINIKVYWKNHFATIHVKALIYYLCHNKIVYMESQPNNPLHGLTLETILSSLVEHYGWEELSYRLRINCFSKDPSLKSSLKFLRKTDWARKKVEDLYIHTISRR